MRKISFINYKGGTGKTTSVVNVGHGLALQGKKVLIIDTDPQGSVAHHLGLSSAFTLYDLIMENCELDDCIIPARKNLDVICANEHLFPAELHMAESQDRELILTDRFAFLNGYDFVLLDCAPSMNLLNQNALLFSDEVFIPVSMDYLSLVGVRQLLKNVALVNHMFEGSIKISTVIPTFFDKRNKKTHDILGSIQRVFPNKLSNPIHVSVALSEAPGENKSIFEYQSNSKAANDYLKLVKEVLYHG